MRVAVGGVRLYVDVDGAKLVPDGPWMRERPTVVMLHPGPGFDHGLLGPHRPVAGGRRPGRLSRHAGCRAQRLRPAGGAHARALGRRRTSSAACCGSSGPSCSGSASARSALRYAARHPTSRRRSSWRAGRRIVPERSVAMYEQLGGAEAGEVARRFYGEMDDHAFTDFVRVCFPLLSSYAMTSEVIARAHWSPEVLMRWMGGEAKTVDLRPELPSIPVPVLVLAGEDDAWAPLESAREVAELLPGRPLPELRARAPLDLPGRTRVLRGAPGLPRRGQGRRGDVVKLAVNGTELFFDVDGAALAPAGPWMRERPTVVLLPTSPGIDHPLQGAHRAGVGRGGAGDLSRHARLRPERLGRAGGVDAGHLGRGPRGVLRRARAGAAGAARHRRGRPDRAPVRRPPPGSRRAARARQRRRPPRPHPLDRRLRPDRRARGGRGGGTLLRRPDRGELRRVHARLRPCTPGRR